MSTGSPFPGLRPFRRDETDIFFGREEQVDELLTILDRSRFLAVVGTSGCGKSSLVRAGMIAGLEAGWMASAGVRWRVAEMRPGTAPLESLVQALLAVSALAPERGGSPEAAAFLGATLRRGPLGLVEVLRETPLPAATNLLVLVDQFEEIFRLHRPEGREEAEAFVALLLETAVQSEAQIYVVITMRSDFLGDCARFADLPEMLNTSQYLAPRLTREQRRAAIVGPARVFDGDVEPALVNHLLNAMGPGPDQLPLLQHLLMRMWTRPGAENRTADRGGRLLIRADFEAVGGLENALSNHADKALAELEPAGRRIAEVLFRALCERGEGRRDTRRPVALLEVAAIAEVPAATVATVVDVFRRPGRSFLTPPHGETLGPESVLDISHESLIRSWGQLAGWVESEARSAETYAFLEQAARRWRAGEAALWGTPDLENALAWQQREQPNAAWALRYGRDFELAMAFLEASENERRRREQEADAARRRELETARALAEARRRANRWLFAGLVVLIAAVLAVLGMKGQAERERRVADSRRLALHADNFRDSRPDLALLVAVEGLRSADTLEARRSLLHALERRPRLARVLALPAGERRVTGGPAPALGRGGRWLAAAGAEGSVRVWDVEAGRPLPSPPAVPGEEAKVVAFGNDGMLAIARGERVGLWDVTAGRPLGEPLRGHEREVTGLTWSADGGWLASGDEQGSAILWQVSGGARIAEMASSPEGHRYAVTALAISPDKTLLATADRSARILLWDLASSPPSAEELPRATGAGEISRLAFDPRGERLMAVDAEGEGLSFEIATRQPAGGPSWRGRTFAFDPQGALVASFGNTLETWHGGAEPATLSLATGEVTRAVFDSSGAWLATERADGAHLVWDLREPPRPPWGRRFEIPGTLVRRVAFSPDGRHLVAGSSSGAIRFWSVASGEPVGGDLDGHADEVTGLAFGPDGTKLVSVGLDRMLRTWDVARRQPVGAPLEGGYEPFTSVAVSPRRQLVATAGRAGGGFGAVRTWDLGRLAPGHDFQGEGDAESVAWSPDGKLLAAAWSGTPGVVVWEVASGEQRPLADSPAGGCGAVAFSAGGLLAAGCKDGGLALWEVAGGSLLELARRSEAAASDGVEALAFDPGGRQLASGHRSGALVLWRITANKLYQAGALQEAGRRVESVAWHPEGKLLASAGSDGIARLWDVDVESWKRRACAVANRNLGAEEWKRFFPERKQRGTTCSREP